jgi:hypothetical protein
MTSEEMIINYILLKILNEEVVSYLRNCLNIRLKGLIVKTKKNSQDNQSTGRDSKSLLLIDKPRFSIYLSEISKQSM